MLCLLSKFENKWVRWSQSETGRWFGERSGKLTDCRRNESQLLRDSETAQPGPAAGPGLAILASESVRAPPNGVGQEGGGKS